MDRNVITYNFTWPRFNELMLAAVQSFNYPKKSYALSVHTDHSTLRAFVLMQEGVNMLNCRIKVCAEDDSGIRVKLTYMPSVHLCIYLFILIAIFCYSRISFANSKEVYYLILFIAPQIFFCTSEMLSYRKFWEHFNNLSSQEKSNGCFKHK